MLIYPTDVFWKEERELMRIKTLILAAAAFGLVVASSAARANNCSDLVVDELSAISDKAKVADAARKFANEGYEVRVRAFKSRRGAKNIDEFQQTYRKECPQWLIGGKLRSSVFLFLYVDNRSSDPWVGAYYGDGLSKLDKEYRKVLAANFIPLIPSFRAGEKNALTPGFVNVLNDFRDIVTRPAAASGPTTIVRKEPTDLSGLWWVLGIVVIIGGGVLLFVLVMRSRNDQGEVQAVQAEARRVRGDCVERLLRVTDESNLAAMKANAEAVRGSMSAAEWKSLERNIGQYEQLGNTGNAALRRFDSPSGEDPNRKALSASVYRTNEQRYAEILAQFVEPAEALALQIAQAVGKAEKAAKVA